MKILFDIVHPAHVHFFKHIISGLEQRGHRAAIMARDKDVTCELLDHYGFAHQKIGKSGAKSRFGQLMELVRRDHALWRLAREFRPDVIVTRNPSGVQVARLCGATGIFDTDDGRAAGVHFKAAAPFARFITTPACINEYYGRKHATYRGFKQSAYLHPNHFQPDPQALAFLGLTPTDRFFIVRFVEMVASHDKGERGFDDQTRLEIVRRMQGHGKVIVSSEGGLPDELKDLRADLPAHLLHDILFYASLYVGDSQTMAMEAAFLGVPNLRISTFAGRIEVLRVLEERYNLTEGYHPQDRDRFLARLDELLEQPGASALFWQRREKLLADTEDVAEWFIAFIEGLKGRRSKLKAERSKLKAQS